MKTVKTRIGGRSEVEVVSKEERLGCSLFRLLRRAACRPGRGSPRVALGVIDDPFLNRQDANGIGRQFSELEQQGRSYGRDGGKQSQGKTNLGSLRSSDSLLLGLGSLSSDQSNKGHASTFDLIGRSRLEEPVEPARQTSDKAIGSAPTEVSSRPFDDLVER
jgi:hypothetical protein